MTEIEMLTSTDFQAKVLEAPGPIVLDFYQASCAPCRTLERDWSAWPTDIAMRPSIGWISTAICLSRSGSE